MRSLPQKNIVPNMMISADRVDRSDITLDFCFTFPTRSRRGLEKKNVADDYHDGHCFISKESAIKGRVAPGQDKEQDNESILIQRIGKGQFFNDVGYYQSLLELEGCCRVDISSLRVHFCHVVSRREILRRSLKLYRIQAYYRLTFADGRTETHSGPDNFLEWPGWCRGRQKETWILLNEGEFFTGIHTSPSHPGFREGVTFSTNARQIHFSEDWESPTCRVTKVSDPQSSRVVAFSGLAGKFQVFGYYTKHRGWETVAPYVLLRSLAIQNRASPKRKRFHHFSSFLKKQALMEGLINLDDESFQHVMEFLI